MPVTDAVTEMPFDEWLDTIWRRPTITLDGSFAAIVDDRVVGFTMLAANRRARPCVHRVHGDACRVSEPRNRRAREARVARWAAANGIRAAWTTNDETNAPMLAVNRRLGYTPRLRRVEYVRER